MHYFNSQRFYESDGHLKWQLRIKKLQRHEGPTRLHAALYEYISVRNVHRAYSLNCAVVQNLGGTRTHQQIKPLNTRFKLICCPLRKMSLSTFNIISNI